MEDDEKGPGDKNWVQLNILVCCAFVACASTCIIRRRKKDVMFCTFHFTSGWER